MYSTGEYPFCRDSEESSKCQIFEDGSPTNFISTLLDEITETAKTAKFILIYQDETYEKAASAQKNDIVLGKTTVSDIILPESQ